MKVCIFWCHPKVGDFRVKLFQIMSRSQKVVFFFLEPSDNDYHFDCVYSKDRKIGQTIRLLPLEDIQKLYNGIRSSDVFISSFIWSTYTMIGLLMAKLMNKKVIVWEEINLIRFDLKSKLKYLIGRLLFWYIDAFFVLGDVQKDVLVELGVEPKKIFVANEYPGYIYSAIRTQAVDFPFDKDERIILYLGRLAEIKGVEYLIRAFALLEKKHKDVALLVVGDGPLLQKLRQLAGTLGIKKIYFAGKITDIHQKAYLFQRSSFVVVPSITTKSREGGPLVVLEALSAGRPVLGTDALGNSTALIQDGVNGYIVQEKDVNALLTKMDFLLSSESIASQKVLRNFYKIKGHNHQAGVLLTILEGLFNDSCEKDKIKGLSGGAEMFPDLSVVIIARNEAKNIARAIESVLEQVKCWPDTEVLLVDSASTDQTVEIAKQYPINIVSLQPSWFMSVAAARHIGMHYTHGAWVLHMDGDMQLAPNWIEQSVSYILEHPEVAAVGGYWHNIYMRDGQIVDEEFCARDPQGRMREVNYVGGASLYRRSAIEEVGGFFPFLKSEEDVDLCMRLRHAGYKVIRLPYLMSTHYGLMENSWKYYTRRLRLGMWLGHGQLLRYHLRTGLLWTALLERSMYTVYYLIGVLISVFVVLLSVFLGNLWFLAVWGAVVLAVLTAFWFRKRSLRGVLLSLLLQSSIAYGALRGFLMKPKPPADYPTNAKVIQLGCCREGVA